MKKILALLVFLLSFSVSALATSITVSSDTFGNYTFIGSTAKLKVWPNVSFVNSDGHLVFAGSANVLYKTVNCTVSGTVASCNSFSIDTTTDSSVSTATYSAALYDSSGRFVTNVLSGFRVPTSLGSPVTWAQLKIYNAGSSPVLSSTYLNANQVSLLIAAQAFKTINTGSIRGNGDISLQVPLVSGTNIKTINGDSLLGSGDLTITGGGGTGTFLSTYSGNLVAALAAIGSTPTTLFVDMNSAAITTNIVVPANVKFVQLNAATFSMSGAGSLNCQAKCISGSEYKLFTTTSVPQALWVNQGQVNLTTDTIGFTAHGQVTGEPVRYTLMRYLEASGTPPLLIGGLADNTIYYVIRLDANNFKIASSYANAMAGTAIDLTAGGQAGFRLDPTPLSFSGTETPKEVSDEIFDTGNNSESQRTTLVTRALTNYGVWIDVYPRNIDAAVLLADGHNVRFKLGDHTNNFNGTTYGWPYYPWNEPWSLGSDAELTSDGGAIIHESTVDYVQSIIATRPGAKHSRIHHNHFLQTNSAQANGSGSGVTIPGGYDNHITDNYFDGIRGYVVAINPIENIDIPDSCSVERNIIKNSLTQVLFLGGGTHVWFTDNIIDARNFSYGVSFSWFDIEPNSKVLLEDILIARNSFDLRGASFLGGTMLGFITVNPAADTETVKRLRVIDNEFLADEDNVNSAVGKFGAVDGRGMSDFEISGNKGYGLGGGWSFISAQKSVGGRIFNNTSYSGAGQIWIQASQHVEVFGNHHFLNNSGTVTNNDGVTEGRFGDGGGSAQSWSFDTLPAADKIQFHQVSYAGFESGLLFSHFLGATVWINNLPYVIKTITQPAPGGNTQIQFTTNLASVPTLAMLVPAADVNAATDTIHYVGHGYVTGAAICYFDLGGGTALGGVRYGYQWVIRVDADNFKLANTAEDAAAGIAVDITSVPVGSTQPFYPGMAIYSSENYYHDNTGPVLLGINSTSYSGPGRLSTVTDTNFTALVDTDTVSFCNSTAGHTVTLPTPVGLYGKVISVMDSCGTAAAKNETITTPFGNVGSSPSFVLATDRGVVKIKSDGANWLVIQQP